MNVETTHGIPIDAALLRNYFAALVDQFFKILPMRENEEETLRVYTCSLLTELLGCQSLIGDLGTDARYMTLLSILQYFTDHPECDVKLVKREVFRSIRLCNHLQKTYGRKAAQKGQVEE